VVIHHGNSDLRYSGASVVVGKAGGVGAQTV